MSLLLIVLSALAVWRVVHMVQDENGPGAIFSKLQAWAARQPDTPGSIGDGFFCFKCMATVLSMVPAIFLAYSVKTFILYWLSIATVAIFVGLLYNRLEQ